MPRKLPAVSVIAAFIITGDVYIGLFILYFFNGIITKAFEHLVGTPESQAVI